MEGEARNRFLFGLILRVCRSHRRIIQRELAALDIYGGQHHMLMLLSELGVTATQAELARRLDVSGATAANMLKRLEAGGYIKRSALKSDSRCNAVTLTEKGQAVVDASRQLFDDLDEKMFSGLNGDDLQAFGRVMEKVNANLRAIEDRQANTAEAGKDE